MEKGKYVIEDGFGHSEKSIFVMRILAESSFRLPVELK